jgi:hypothetical protein
MVARNRFPQERLSNTPHNPEGNILPIVNPKKD